MSNSDTLHLLSLVEFTDLLNGCAPDAHETFYNLHLFSRQNRLLLYYYYYYLRRRYKKTYFYIYVTNQLKLLTKVDHSVTAQSLVKRIIRSGDS